MSFFTDLPERIDAQLTRRHFTEHAQVERRGQVPPTPYSYYIARVRRLLDRQRSFGEIEDYINDAPLDDDAKAALWLLAAVGCGDASVR